MDRFSILKLGILIRFYGLKISNYQYLLPWYLFSTINKLELVTIIANEDYFIVAIDYDIIKLFNDDNVIDTVWIFTSAKFNRHNNWNQFIKHSRRGQTNTLRINEDIINELYMFRSGIDSIIGTIEFIYPDQWTNSLTSWEIQLLQKFCGRQLRSISLLEE